tara:strand:- start:6570 stop:6866 length:297 start_codon:yes stop_codon:yes gene_type:complete
MANVDPFVIQWPTQWVQDPEIGPVVQYLNRFLHDLWIRTGGGDDIISDNENINNGDNAVLGQMAVLSNRIEELNAQIARTNTEFAIMQTQYDDLEKQQ